jgi:hypothetical protein
MGYAGGNTAPDTLRVLIGSSPSPPPGGGWSKARLALLRATRTFIQGIAAAFGAAGPGSAILSTTYWRTFGVSCLAALVTGVVSFLQNIARFLPEDPTQTQPPSPSQPPQPTPSPPPA